MADTSRPKIAKTDAEWRAELTPEQYQVTREHGTERPFTGPYLNEKRKGMYVCVSCGNPLFASDTKYESGSGWPSFYAPASKDAVASTRIVRCSCAAPKSVARLAKRISVMSSTTGRNRRGCAIA